jgi:predicted nucleic acid-binding protein
MAGSKSTKRQTVNEFVLDSSMAVAWSFEDETDEYADRVQGQLSSKRAVVPALWPLEVANALLVGERRKRSTEAETTKWTAMLADLPVSIDDQTNSQAWTTTLALARLYNLSAYDAAYLELAIRRGLPLAALDQQLKTAAKAAGVKLL